MEQVNEHIHEQIDELRKVYETIKQRNQSIPEPFRLPKDAFRLPKEVYVPTLKIIEDECSDVYRSHEYESAESLLYLSKIHKFYTDAVETPHIVVYDMCHTLQVHTIRTNKNLNTEDFEARVKKMPSYRQRIADIVVQMQRHARDFNKLVFAASDEKTKVLAECQRLKNDIKKLHAVLPEQHHRELPQVYDMEPEEMPHKNKIFDTTQEQVKGLEKTLLEEAGLGHIEQEIKKNFLEGEWFGKKPHQSDDISVHPQHFDLESHFKSPDLDTDKDLSAMLLQQEQLFDKLDRLIASFHERIKHLQNIRGEIDIESKIKQIGILKLISKLNVVTEFYEQEHSLQQTLVRQEEECRSAECQVNNLKRRSKFINDEIKDREDQLVVLFENVERSIGENNVFHDYLVRVYRKQDHDKTEPIMVAEGNHHDSQDTYRHLTAGHLSLDTCPEHCDRQLYDKILEMRKTHLDFLHEIETFQNMIKEIAAECNSFEERHQEHRERASELIEKIKDLQDRRQKKINDFKVAVILRLDQIQEVDLGNMNQEVLDKLSRCFYGTEEDLVIFPAEVKDKRVAKTEELTTKSKAKQNEIRKAQEKVNRIRHDHQKMEQQVQTLRQQVHEEMTKKFGRVFNLDKIKVSSLNTQLAQEEQRLWKTKQLHYTQRAHIDKELQALQDQLRKKIQENSKLNMLHAVLLERKRDLEYYVWKHENIKRKIGEAEVTEEDQLSLKLKPAEFEGFDYSVLDQDIQDARIVIRKQDKRIKELREILAKCRSKSAIPPLVFGQQGPKNLK